MSPLHFTLSSSVLVAFSCFSVSGCSDAPTGTGFEYRGVNLCLSDLDRATIDLHLLDAGAADEGLGHPNEVSVNCAGVCVDVIFAAGDVDGCVSDCLDTTSLEPLSDGCAGCFIDAVLCGQEYCISDCISSADDNCGACMVEHCFPGQEACTGLQNL